MTDTLTIDLAAIRLRRESIATELAELDAIIALAPRMKAMALPITPAAANGRVDGPKAPKLTDLARKFIIEQRAKGPQFTMTDAIAWFTAHMPGFQTKEDRDDVTAAFRYLVKETRELHIHTPGQGQRPQVWGFGPSPEPKGGPDGTIKEEATQ